MATDDKVPVGVLIRNSDARNEKFSPDRQRAAVRRLAETGITKIGHPDYGRKSCPVGGEYFDANASGDLLSVEDRGDLNRLIDDALSAIPMRRSGPLWEVGRNRCGLADEADPRCWHQYG